MPDDHANPTDPSPRVEADHATVGPALDLSVAIVCKNGEATIGRTLESVRGLASEIVALDSGSTDRTIAMLEQAGVRIQRVEWQGYNRTKQMAAEACTRAWVMNIDADESVEPDLAASLREALGTGGGSSLGGGGSPAVPDAFMVNRKVWYAGGFLHHAWQPEWRVRVVRRAMFDPVGDGTPRAAFAGHEPHDELVVRGGRVGRLTGTLRHDTIADMHRFLAGQLRLAEIGARVRGERGERGSALRVLTSPAGAFLKQIVLRSAWRDGWRGWAAAGATACHTLMRHLILLDRTRRGRGEPPAA